MVIQGHLTPSTILTVLTGITSQRSVQIALAHELLRVLLDTFQRLQSMHATALLPRLAARDSHGHLYLVEAVRLDWHRPIVHHVWRVVAVHLVRRERLDRSVDRDGLAHACGHFG